jgi:hypothetical protein
VAPRKKDIGGRPREIEDGYRAMHLMPRAWIPFWERLIDEGRGTSEADLIRRACMAVYKELPDPHTPEYRAKLKASGDGNNR